jgi:hypothetical protein
MIDEFQTIIDRYRARMVELSDAFYRDGRLLAISERDPEYSIILTRNGSSPAPWRVTSFRGKEPIGHREYNMLEGGSPIQNAFAEFAGDGMRLVPRKLSKRDMERKMKEAHEALTACREAVEKTPDETGKAIFERSARIWERRLAGLQI